MWIIHIFINGRCFFLPEPTPATTAWADGYHGQETDLKPPPEAPRAAAVIEVRRCPQRDFDGDRHAPLISTLCFASIRIIARQDFEINNDNNSNI